MSKLKEITKMFGVGALGVVYFVVSIVFSLAFFYFGIKIVMSLGDRVFNKDESSQSTPTPNPPSGKEITKDNQQIRASYIDDCVKSGGYSEALCSCAYNGLWVEYSEADLKQIITTQKYTDSQLETTRMIYANCGFNNAYYR